jgi:RNA polymerase sigma-70 factor (ECF subfamily)
LAQLASWYLDGRDVDDVLQEVWASVYRKLWQLEDDGHLLPWLKTITFHTCLNYRKARAARLRAEAVLPPDSWSAVESYVSDGGSSLDEILETGDLRQVISRELDRLPGTYGPLLRLRYLRDLSYREISDAVGMPVNLVKQRLHQGREILRSRLARSLRGTGKGYRAIKEE